MNIESLKEALGKLDAATARVSELEDWAGIEAGASIADLQAPKGAADAVKQFEAKLKRAERERDDAMKARDEINTKFRSNAQRVAITEALNAHDFADRDVAETYISRFVEWNEDALVFKSEDGRILNLKDGVAAVVKTKPALLKSQGTGGAGFQGAGAGSNGGSKTMTRAEWDATDHVARREFAKAGGKVVDAAA